MAIDATNTPSASEPRPAALVGRALSILLVIVGCVLLAATLAGFLGRAAWWLDLTNHFRQHLAVALVLVAAGQWFARPRMAAAAWAAGAAVNLILLSPLWMGTASPAGAPRVTIVHANVGGDAVDAAALAGWVNELSPEWVSLQEITPRNLPKVAAKLPDYDVVADAPRLDTRGVALLHRHDPAATRPAFAARTVSVTPDGNRPMICFDFDLAGRAVSVLGFHTTRPAPGSNWRWQREAMDAAAVWAAAQQLAGGEAILIGDFNGTSQGVLAEGMCRMARLGDARRGNGINGTWPSNLPAPLRIGIDAAYHSAGLVSTAFEVGPDIGSDHLPIAVTFAPGG